MNAYPMTMVAATLALQDILARLRGRAALYPGAILFVIAALLATATNSLVSLTFTRALQGLGGAALLCGLPSDTSTSSNDPPSGRNAAMTATLAAVSSCALPSLAGVVASAALYHWFFALSALLVIAGVFASDSSSLTIRRSAGAKAALRASALGSLTLSSISLGLWEYANHASDYLLRAFIGTALLFGVIWLKEWLYDTAPLDFSEFRPRRDRCMESSFRPPFTAPKSWLCSP
jgi:DHA2 family multidrug resistance protein-like MFS transporter